MYRRSQQHYKFCPNPRNPIPNWRLRIEHTQLISQTSSILLQRHSKFWVPLFRSIRLSSNFSPYLFHQILNKIKTSPLISLRFFDYARKNLGFEPGLKVQCDMIRMLVGSGLSKPGMRLLDSIIQDYPPAKFVPLLIQSGKSESFQNVCDFVVEGYCSKSMYLQSLEVYQMAKQYGVGLGVGTLNSLLNLLCDKNELRFAWCFYASIIRFGNSVDHFTWSVIARILYKDGKFERISRILDNGTYTPEMFDFLIDGYSRKGDFEPAFAYLNRRIQPSFSTYSSILDGACKYNNGDVIKSIMSLMVDKGHIPESCDYDSIIQKLCDQRKTYAMDLFFKRAHDNKIELKHAIYRCMLMALLSEHGRIGDAIELYNLMRGKNVSADKICYDKFVDVLCKEKPSQGVSNLLIDMIQGGSVSEFKGISEYISKLCGQHRWREAEELLNSALEHGVLVEASSFMKRYCRTGRIDEAIILQNKLEGLDGILETATYEVLLVALFKERRIEEAMKVFDYMRRCKVLSSGSFSIMIRNLCEEKEFRKAMKLHDEMMELGLKPDRKAYVKLIYGFR